MFVRRMKKDGYLNPNYDKFNKVMGFVSLAATIGIFLFIVGMIIVNP